MYEMNSDYLTAKEPLITIGMPVFNGATTLAAAIESILGQNFSDFEFIISDNCSTDETDKICRQYAEKDARIRYFRQAINLGAEPNFAFVLERSVGKYFMWAAADDIRSPDFIEINVNFLERNPDYVASTSPDCFEGQECDGVWRNFAIIGDIETRIMRFLDHCWDSHAIFYSVMRTNVIQGCDFLGKEFLGFDWAIDLFLTKQGQINRSLNGQLILGRKGMSNSGNPWRAYRKRFHSWLLPFYQFSYYTWRIATIGKLNFRIKLAARLLVLNCLAVYQQLYAELLPYYQKYVRSLVKGV